MGAEKYRQVPLLYWLGNQLGVIWVERFNADFSAVRATLARLKKGGVLVLAPEGTRSHTGALQEAWAGVSFLAVKAGVPIVPVALIGSDDSLVFSNLRRLKRTLVTIRVGKPFMLPPISGDRDSALKSYTDEIMCRIAALLPPERRGVYAEHPRLKELLQDAS
jgi:1-acyl-sn-glycerol-3-phosphate acyltransferase